MENDYIIHQTMKIFAEIATKLISPSFKFSKGGEAIRIVSQALERLEKKYGSLSRERIEDYCVSAAYSFKDRGERWKINQVFGPKSVEKFGTDRRVKYYEDRWLASAEITRSHLLSYLADKSKHPHQQYVYMPMEEPTKKRMLNSQAGYIICQSSTLGWSPESESCSRCKFVSKCKIETQKRFPEIYRLRLEHGIKDCE